MGEGREIDYSRKFLKQASHLPGDIIDIAQEKEAIFKLNPFDPRLDTHKLHGKERGAWAFSVTHSWRIKFIFFPEKRILFLEIGTHRIYT